MNSSDLFIFAAAGAQTENSMGVYQNYVNSQNQNIIGGLTGWLAEKAQKVQDNFSGFVNSRLWEYSARLLGEGNGEHVGRFEIGYLGTLNGIQGAEGLMQNYIMANPNVMKLYEEDIIEGYGGGFSPLCTGIGADNYFFRQANNGVTRKEEIEGVPHWMRSHYQDTIGEGLSFRDRVNIHKTWAAVDAHLASTYLDITSPLCKNRKDHVTETKEM